MLGVDELAVVADRRVRTDVGVDEPRVGADDRGPSHDGVHERRAGFDHDPALYSGRLVDLPVVAGTIVSSTSRLQWSSGSFLPVSIHHPSSTSWRTRWP